MRKGLLFAACCLLIVVGVPLVYLALRGVFPAVVNVFLSIAYVGAISLLVRYQKRAFPNTQLPSSFRITPKARDFGKAVLCLLAAFFWGFIVISLMGDTPIANALAVGPGLVIIAFAAYFYYRSTEG